MCSFTEVKPALRDGVSFMRRRLLFIAFAAVLVGIALIAVQSEPFGNRTRATVLLQLQPIASGLERPISMSNAADGTNRLFILEQPGVIRVYNGTQLLEDPFLDITAFVSCCGERGLLGLAFSPDYTTSGVFYVTYTRIGGDVVLARYEISTGDANIAEAASGYTLLVIPHPEFNHNGGQIQFGPDGYLYMSVGDGGGANGDPDDDAQNLQNMLGTILRLDVSSEMYTVPPDNPFVSNPGALDEIWAYGFRNPWRFSFDRVTGDMYIADVGEVTHEELNVQPAASAGGENYGWNRMEGFSCFNPPQDCDNGTFAHPALDYAHVDGNCAITGGYRYRGEDVDTLSGLYVYGDFCSGRIWGAYASSGGWNSIELYDAPFFVPTFGQDEHGELYVTDMNGGILYQIVTAAPDSDGDGYPDDDETVIGEDPDVFCSIMRADVDQDGSVTIIDLSTVGGIFLHTIPPAPARYDQDTDASITVLDLSIMAGVFQSTVSQCP